eukprot:767610-Hanusia_phi.AAC.6
MGGQGYQWNRKELRAIGESPGYEVERVVHRGGARSDSQSLGRVVLRMRSETQRGGYIAGVTFESVLPVIGNRGAG